MNLENNKFTDWSSGSPIKSKNQDIIGPDDWRIKTTSGPLEATVSNISNGMKVAMYFPSTSPSYCYIRQLIPDVMQFSGKKGKLIVDVTRNSWQEIGSDVYIQARMNEDDADRVLVIDSDNILLDSGRQTITVNFTVPVLPIDKLTLDNSLSVAFRFIGSNQNSECLVHSIKLEMENTTPPIDPNPPVECNPDEVDLTPEAIEKVADAVVAKMARYF